MALVDSEPDYVTVLPTTRGHLRIAAVMHYAHDEWQITTCTKPLPIAQATAIAYRWAAQRKIEKR